MSSVEAPMVYCERITRGHYENFPVGWFIPRRMQKHIFALYAFARTADDFADETTHEGERLERLDEWSRRLQQAAAGRADHPLFAALAQSFQETALPQQLLEDLLTAFRMDVTKKRYQDYAELENYCRYSANPIGRAVLMLFGYSDTALLELSDKICTAIQLVNHWQDIAVDLKKDRVYLPAAEMQQFGYRYEDLKAGRVNDPFRALMRFQLNRARTLFQEGRPLLKRLKRRLRWQVGLMWSGPMKILDKIEAADFDIFKNRPSLSKRELLALFLKERIQWA